MSVLELSEESRLLREAAKGWAAGSVPLDDYRMIRRATLATMLAIDPDEEDTVAGLVPGGMLADDAEDRTETVDHIPPSAQRRRRRTTIIIIAGAAVLVVGGALALLLVV